MASTKDYLTYVLDLLREMDGISYKPMMGEFLLYKDGVLFGGVYDNRFLVKQTKSISGKGMVEQIPYPGARPMYLVDEENPSAVKELVLSIYKDLAKR